MFNILIPTEQHENHLYRHITCDCSTKTTNPSYTKQPDDTNNEKIPNFHLSITMKKVSILVTYIITTIHNNYIIE